MLREIVLSESPAERQESHVKKLDYGRTFHTETEVSGGGLVVVGIYSEEDVTL